MNNERKHLVILSSAILFLTILLFIRSLLSIIEPTQSQIFRNSGYVDLIWPILGLIIVIQFLRNDTDGWGGILFHIFILYCGIYFAIFVIITLLGSYSSLINVFLSLLLYMSISAIAWMTYLYYYD